MSIPSFFDCILLFVYKYKTNILYMDFRKIMKQLFAWKYEIAQCSNANTKLLKLNCRFQTLFSILSCPNPNIEREPNFSVWERPYPPHKSL